MNAVSLLGFSLFGLSFFQFMADVAGSFIALDAASVIYFLLYPKRLLANRKILVWIAGALLMLICTRIIIGANEFAFLARVGLIFIDAFFLRELFRSKGEFIEATMCSHALLLAGIAYALVFFVWLVVPFDTENIFYLNNSKAWIATFPALFAASQLVANRPKIALILSIAAIFLSFTDSSVSRALLLQSLLMLIIALWQINRRLAKLVIFIAGVSSLFFVTAFNEFVEKHDHSNTFRMIMILQIFDFSIIETTLGRGIDMWRIAAFNALFDMPGAEAFFETANPHFFPAEVIIRGGLALFICIFGAFYVAFQRTRLVAVPAVMLLATFFTTNTGVERLYMTLGIFVLVSVRADQIRRSAIINSNKNLLSKGI
jgi:hypothetical protein